MQIFSQNKTKNNKTQKLSQNTPKEKTNKPNQSEKKDQVSIKRDIFKDSRINNGFSNILANI